VAGLSCRRRQCCGAAKFNEKLFIFPAIAIVIAARVLSCRRLCRLLGLRLWWTQDNLAVDGEVIM
jgi:hypothetical protein